MKLYQHKPWLMQKYIVEKLTISDISKLAGTSDQVVQYWLKKHQLIRNPRTWTR